MIREAKVSDERLEQLVCQYRDKAGAAHRFVSGPEAVKLYREAQNGWADLIQELLDRRRSHREVSDGKA